MKPARVLMVLNKVERELGVMNAVKREIAALRPDAEVRILPYDARFYDEALAFRPDVVLTFPMTSVGLAEPYYVHKFLFGTKVVCFRAEGIIDPASAQSLANHTGYDRYGPRLIDYEIFWGPGPAELIGRALVEQRKLSSSERVKCVGYPRLERYFGIPPVEGSAPLPPAVTARLSQHGRERTVLIATGFHFANYTREMIFAAKDLDAENRCDELLGIIEEVKRFRAGWIEALRAAADQNPGLLFVLKKHPIERREDYAALEGLPNVLYVWQGVDIGDLMERAGLFVHYGSTSLADSYLARVPAVYLHSREPRCRDWFPDMGWPSARSAPCDELPALIREFREGRITAVDTPAVRKVLEFNFNVRADRPYLPAREIALLLLGEDRGQSVPVWDRHLWTALARHSYLRLRRLVGRPIKRMLGMTRGAP